MNSFWFDILFLQTYKFYEILICLKANERKEGMDCFWRQDFKIPKIRKRIEKMECDCKNNGRRISDRWSDWQAVQRTV